jgi:hypothetical protein
MTESQRDTREHIARVQVNIDQAVENLAERAIAHDLSKLEEPELSGYEGLSQALKGLTYGTPEHRAAFAPYKEIIQHHYASNRHHPEHWQMGVTDMSLLDIIEMLADWKAANDRNGGDFGHSIQVSVNRFRISEQLHAILINTAKELGWL